MEELAWFNHLISSNLSARGIDGYYVDFTNVEVKSTMMMNQSSGDAPPVARSFVDGP